MFDLQDLQKLRAVSGLADCFTKVTAAKISDALDAFNALSIDGADEITSKAPEGAAQLEVQREVPQEPTDVELEPAKMSQPATQGPEARAPEGKAASNPQVYHRLARRTRMLRVRAARGRQMWSRSSPAGRRTM